MQEAGGIPSRSQKSNLLGAASIIPASCRARSSNTSIRLTNIVYSTPLWTGTVSELPSTILLPNMYVLRRRNVRPQRDVTSADKHLSANTFPCVNGIQTLTIENWSLNISSSLVSKVSLGRLYPLAQRYCSGMLITIIRMKTIGCPKLTNQLN